MSDAVEFQRIPDDRPDGHTGVQRGVGVLEDDLHVITERTQFGRTQFEDVFSHEVGFSTGGFNQAK